MRSDATTDATGLAAGALGERFEPLLRRACGGRLGPIAWFKADWQRGGARTGRAKYRIDDDREVDVVVKIPVGPVEFNWNHRLQPDEKDRYGITATLFASGTTLGDYDLAWLVMERFPEGPLLGLQREDAIDLMADAVVRFYKRARRFPVDRPAPREEWPEVLARARQSCQTNEFPGRQSWNTALKRLQRKFDSLLEEWNARNTNEWCHGDLHPANAMSRSNRPEDPAMLIDLAEVRPGCWVEDAVYLERIYWPRPEIIERHPPVERIASKRREAGLEVDERAMRLAEIRRVLFAASAPAFLRGEGNPIFLDVCHRRLEAGLDRLHV